MRRYERRIKEIETMLSIIKGIPILYIDEPNECFNVNGVWYPQDILEAFIGEHGEPEVRIIDDIY